MSSHFLTTDIKLYSVYIFSDFIFYGSICPRRQPCYSCLFNCSIFVVSSSIKVSSRNKEISTILIPICSGIKSDISIITSSRFCRNIYFPSTFTAKDHCVCSNTATKYSNFSISSLVYCSTFKYVEKVRVETI